MKPSFEQTLVEVWRQTLVEDAKAEGYFCQPSWLPGFSKSRKPNKQVPTSLSDGSRMEFLRATVVQCTQILQTTTCWRNCRDERRGLETGRALDCGVERS
jgi:hypothetical protein